MANSRIHLATTDVNQLANLIGRIATGEVKDDAPPEPEASPEKDPAAVALGSGIYA